MLADYLAQSWATPADGGRGIVGNELRLGYHLVAESAVSASRTPSRSLGQVGAPRTRSWRS